MQSVLNEENVFSLINGFFSKSAKKAKQDKKRGVPTLNGSIAKYSKNLIMSFLLIQE